MQEFFKTLSVCTILSGFVLGNVAATNEKDYLNFGVQCKDSREQPPFASEQFNKKLDMKSVIKILSENIGKSESKASDEILECEDQMSAEEYKQRLDNIFTEQLKRLSVFKTLQGVRITDTIDDLDEYKRRIHRVATDMLYKGEIIMSKKMREYVWAHHPTIGSDGNRTIGMWTLGEIQMCLNYIIAARIRWIMTRNRHPFEEMKKWQRRDINGQPITNPFGEKNNTQISDQVDDNINVKSVIEVLLEEEGSRTEDPNEVVEDEDKMSAEEFKQRREAIYTDFINKVKGWQLPEGCQLPKPTRLREHVESGNAQVRRRIYGEGKIRIYNDNVKKYISARRPAPFAGGNRTICMLELANIERYLDLEYRERACQVHPILKGRGHAGLG